MTPRQPRLRETRKWLVTSVALVILVAWPLSRWWVLSVVLLPQRSVRIMSGCIFAGTDMAPVDGHPSVPPGFYFLENLMRELGMFWKFRHVKTPVNEFVIVPLWAPLLITLVPAVIMWRRDIVERRRRRAGLCPSCGYDRRTLPPTTPCPECGRTRPR